MTTKPAAPKLDRPVARRTSREIEPPSKGLVLAICCCSLLIVSMDATAVNVALPSIRADLHTDVSTLQWTIDGYTLAIASFLLLGGATADRVGRRRVFQIGLTVFGLASLLCSLAPNVQTLVGARVLQGIGGSMLNPVAMSIITNTFTDRRERARAVGVWGAVVGVSMAFGPLVGGLLTEHVSWRGIFWINVPIALAAVILCHFFVPESRAARPRRIDGVGQTLAIVFLASLVYALIEAPQAGWGSPRIVVLLAVAVLAALCLVLVERRVAEPFLDLRFFRSVPFASATITALIAFAAYGAFLFVNALYLQQVRGLSPFDAGLRMLPLALTTLVASLASGRLVSLFGTRPSLVFAGTMLALSGISLTFLTTDTSWWLIGTSYVLFGLGFGAINAPITNTAVSGMPVSQAGVAAGVASTCRQTGSAIGVALAGTLTGVGAATNLGPSFAAHTHPLWWLVTVVGVVVLLLGVLASTGWAQRSTEQVNRLLDESAEAAA
ncbi:MFS transporter [Nocardioides sp. BP30]|uniref:MFS transporter n=1 Tax=Nocardioides sp. BP30 TaxID=3036374 RepID=UPI0024685DC2|nr:MFS transporter [Nocardioides sp. BP30]WGL51022.1 MFS transporter [Nocardioides sp. BP30]